MSRSLTNAEVNHLRRLIGWIRSGIPQAPDDLMETVKRIAPALDDPPTDFQKQALVRMHTESAYVPKYIRAGIKALEKKIKEAEGDIVDAEAEKNRLEAKPLALGSNDTTSSHLSGEK